MGALDKAKILADITKLGAEVYGILADKALARSNADRDRKIAELEAEIRELKKKAAP